MVVLSDCFEELGGVGLVEFIDAAKDLAPVELAGRRVLGKEGLLFS